jgi:hypothetical protein
MSQAFREKLQPIVQTSVSAGAESAESKAAGYRALSGPAIVSAICAALSPATFLHVSLAVFPVASLVLGWLALRQIDRNPMEMSGRKLAYASMALACVFWAAGSAWLYYQQHYSVPADYELITFKDLKPDFKNIDKLSSETADLLADRHVFLRGFMAPGKQQSGIKEFVLMDEPNTCKYCAPQPTPSRLVRVKFTGGVKIDYTAREIGVGGKFIVHPVPKAENGMLIYEIEADLWR